MLQSMNIENRVYWTRGIFDSWNRFTFLNTSEAAEFLRSSKLNLVYNIMGCFESIPVTFPETEDILKGKHPKQISSRDYLKIRSFASAVDLLSAAVAKGLFEFSAPALKLLHKKAARHELSDNELGQFRVVGVKLGNLKYNPPVSVALNKIWQKGMLDISRINDPLESAVTTFLWLSRTQFFANCNKRTSVLAMSGIQTSNLYPCTIFPKDDQKSFATEIRYFYETGNADRIINLFRSYHEISVESARSGKWKEQKMPYTKVSEPPLSSSTSSAPGLRLT